MIESQIEFVLQALAGGGTLEVSSTAEQAWTETLDARAESTVWTTGGCDSWYVDPRSGRLTLLWPGFAHEFRAALEEAVLQLTVSNEARS